MSLERSLETDSRGAALPPPSPKARFFLTAVRIPARPNNDRSEATLVLVVPEVFGFANSE